MRQALAAAALALISACGTPSTHSEPPRAPRLRLAAAPSPIEHAPPSAEARLGPPGGSAGAGLRHGPSAERAATPPAVRARSERTLREPLVSPEETRAIVLLYHAFDRGNVPLSVPSARLEKQIG